MLDKQDRAVLQEAFDWAANSGFADEERTFVFSSADSAREATEELTAGDVKAKYVPKHSVKVARPANPNVKRVWSWNEED